MLNASEMKRREQDRKTWALRNARWSIWKAKNGKIQNTMLSGLKLNDRVDSEVACLIQQQDTNGMSIDEMRAMVKKNLGI